MIYNIYKYDYNLFKISEYDRIDLYFFTFFNAKLRMIYETGKY